MSLKRLLLVALALSLVGLAGCGAPDDGADEEPAVGGENATFTPEGETPTVDNEQGGNPVNPPDDRNRTNATTPDEGDGAAESLPR